MLFVRALFLYPIVIFSSTDAFRLGNIVCESDPEAINHSTLECDGSRGCKLECNQNFKFPRGEKVLDMTCVNGKIWGVKSYGNLIPDCEATCFGGCRNGGKCEAPDTCACKAGFMGRNCEIRVEVCPEKVPMPSNTMGKCVITGTNQVQTCKVTCVEGFKFPDGSITADILCRNGRWTMQPRHFPKCEPYCNPLCQNGGTCIGPNICQCTDDFRGNLCQYSTQRCSPKNIGFNGMYKCTGTYEKMECNLSCPAGFNPEYPLSSVYTCRYDEGIYRPQRIPKCDYKGMQAIITHA